MTIQERIISIITDFLSVLGVGEPMVGQVIGTFLFLFGELVLLFMLISFLVALLQIYISKDKIQKALTTKSKLLNSILGALLGSVTPFCSCSTIPLLLGLMKSRAPFSGMMSFLLTSPILNPAIIVLFLTFFGIVPTIIYAGVAFIFAVIVGYILDKKKFYKYIKGAEGEAYMESLSAGAVPASEPETCCGDESESSTSCCGETSGTSSSCYDSPKTATACCETTDASTACCETPEESSDCCNETVTETSCCDTSTSCCDGGEEVHYSDFEGGFVKRNLIAFKYAFLDAGGLFRKVLLFLLLGAGIGAFIYGFVPTDFIQKFAGEDNFLAVPIAAVLGIPMYIRTETMIPIASVLVGKGVGLGPMVALIIGGAGASIPEVSLLASIFKKQLVITFLLCIFSVATLTGFAFVLFL